MSDIEKELKLSTIAELEDHLQELSELLYGKSLAEFGQHDFEKFFRLVHSIKGNTRACGYESIAEFSHFFESKLLLIKNGDQEFDNNSYDMCLYYLNTLTDVNEILKKDYQAAIDLREELASFESFGKVKISKIAQTVPKLNILLIDDDDNIQDIIVHYIDENFWADTKSCENGLKGLDLCEKNQYDVIICDYKMPELNGSEFIMKLRKGKSKNSETPIIFLSGFKPAIQADQKIWHNVFFTDKPFSEQKLVYYIKCSLKLREKIAA